MSAMGDEGLLRTGEMFGGFTIERLAGRGGMGIVYRARQHQPVRSVALKVMSPEIGADRIFRTRFEREATIAAQIEHPNVIPVYAVGEEQGTLYIAMRFVDGTDLRSEILASGRLDPARAVGLVDQVGEALDAAHQQGLVHRDVKPANILIARTGAREHVYLTDFGLTRDMQSAGDLSLTGQGGFMGTIDYASPEQARGEHAHARSDVYALGCVLFHALTGTTPFAGNDLAKLYAHATHPPPALRDRVGGLPAELEKVVARALAKDPGARYPSAGDLGRAARAAMSGSTPGPEHSVATGDAAVIARGLAATRPSRRSTMVDIGSGLAGPLSSQDPDAPDPAQGQA